MRRLARKRKTRERSRSRQRDDDRALPRVTSKAQDATERLDDRARRCRRWIPRTRADREQLVGQRRRFDCGLDGDAHDAIRLAFGLLDDQAHDAARMACIEQARRERDERERQRVAIGDDPCRRRRVRRDRGAAHDGLVAQPARDVANAFGEIDAHRVARPAIGERTQLDERAHERRGLRSQHADMAAQPRGRGSGLRERVEWLDARIQDGERQIEVVERPARGMDEPREHGAVRSRARRKYRQVVGRPEGGILAIGSGGPYAQAAARALLENSALSPKEMVEKALAIAGEICIYTNQQITIESLE